MRVNINGVWHDAEQEPIQIELTDRDKENIVNMHTEAHNYIVFPDTIKYKKVKEILKINAMSSLQLDDVLQLNNAWCLKDVLKKLIEASEILLHQKNYDGHGWEQINHCVDRGKDIVSLIS